MRDNLRVKEVVVGDGERRHRYVVCHNPDEEKRQREHRAKLVAELETELASMQQSKTGRHSKRACELLASARYGKYLRQLAAGELRIDRGAIQEAERYDGKWVITSNDDTLTAEDLALGYKHTEVRPDAVELLEKLCVAPPPKLHSVQSAPAAEPVTTGGA